MQQVPKIPKTIKVFMFEPCVDDMIGDLEPFIDETEKIYDGLSLDGICDKLCPIKQQVVRGLVDGDNFSQIGKRLHLKPSEIYKIKEELKEDLSYLRGSRSNNVTIEQLFINRVKQKVATGMTLSDFISIFIADYDRRGNLKWLEPAIQDKVFDIWESQTDAPFFFGDKQLKVITVISYLIRTLFLRKRPMIIDYYYNDRKYLIELVKRFKQIIRNSPIIHDDFQLIPCDDDFGFKLRDGSAIRTFYDRGRKPVDRGSLVIFDDGRDELPGYQHTGKDKIIVVKSSSEVFNQARPPIISVLS